MKTTVVNIRDEPFDVYIGRAGHGYDGYFGNSIALPPSANGFTRRALLERFRDYFLERIETDSEFCRRVLELRGKRLGCFCKPKHCHGDIIASWLNQHMMDGQ